GADDDCVSSSSFGVDPDACPVVFLAGFGVEDELAAGELGEGVDLDRVVGPGGDGFGVYGDARQPVVAVVFGVAGLLVGWFGDGDRVGVEDAGLDRGEDGVAGGERDVGDGGDGWRVEGDDPGVAVRAGAGDRDVVDVGEPLEAGKSPPLEVGSRDVPREGVG